eukprot:796829-Rhodomonas_salina.2
MGQASSPLPLRVCYAKSGTDMPSPVLAYHITDVHAMHTPVLSQSPVLQRVRYTKPSTDKHHTVRLPDPALCRQHDGPGPPPPIETFRFYV